MRARWPGTYSDAHGHEAISISMDRFTLSMELQGVTFTGASFDDFAPATSLPAHARFTLHDGALCACILTWTMPITLSTADGEQQADLNCRLVLGEPGDRGGLSREDLSLTLHYPGGRAATATPHGFFETALAAIQRQLPPGQHLKSCISCAFSDYRPGGNGLFGDLACFRDNQQGYLAVTTKADIFRVWDTFTEHVPETYLCPQFQPRRPHAGYRGGFPDS
jgi:hypothetical protein